MHYCSAGHPIMLPTLIVRIDDKIYCADHAPVPEPSEPMPDTKPWKMTERQRKRLGFGRWLYENGKLPGDDYAEPLSDEDKDRLAKHIVP